VLAALAVAVPSSADVVVDAANRDVTTENFFLDWSNTVPTNPEELGVVRWSAVPHVGGPISQNLTATSDFPAPCDGLLEHFGNSWAPPDPGVVGGGTILVGEGSTGTWSAGPGPKKVTIQSTATGCPHSAGVPVVTTYQFWENAPFKATAGPWQRIKVTRTFTFTDFNPNVCGTGISCFRAYIPRLLMDPFAPQTGFGEVLYPTTGHTLASATLGFFHPCLTGCSDTHAPGATTPLPGGSWDATQGWFAMNNPTTGDGLIVKRVSSTPADLWLDWDCAPGCSPDSTNSSSILLLLPAHFTGTVTEEEHLCFYDAITWPAERRAALTLPQGC